MTRTDTERFDFIVAHFADFGSMSDLTATPPVTKIFARVECRLGYHWHCYDGATPRDAMDAAMDAGPCGEHAAGGFFERQCQETTRLMQQFVRDQLAALPREARRVSQPTREELRARIGRQCAIYAGVPGSGPPGRTCHSCAFLVYTDPQGRAKHPKCGKTKYTHGDATTIKTSTAACSLFEERT